VDRKKDLIKTSGLQVWPREIEEALAEHPAVAEVGVAGVPDASRGEMVKAWVASRRRTGNRGRAPRVLQRADRRQSAANDRIPRFDCRRRSSAKCSGASGGG
jgi:long-chain acyl-CoA synthetase